MRLLVHQGPASHRVFLCYSSEHHAPIYRSSLVCLGALWIFGAWGPSYPECLAWALSSVPAAALWLPLWCLVALWSILCQQAFPRRSALGFLAVGPGVLIDTTCVLSIGSIGRLSSCSCRWEALPSDRGRATAKQRRVRRPPFAWSLCAIVGRLACCALGPVSFCPIQCPAFILFSASWYIDGAKAADSEPDPPEELAPSDAPRAEPDWVARQVAARARYETTRAFLEPCVSEEVGDPNIVLPEPPPPFAERAVLAPFVAEASQAITEGGWLGVYIYAPNYHTQLGAVRIVPTASEQDVVDLVLSLTHEQWDHWPRRVAPASCQPTLGSATFLTFPAILDECGLRAIIVDLSQLDGSRFAISVKAGCQAPDLLQAADIEMPPQEVQLLIAGDPDPWQPDASLPLSHGDVVFVVPLAKTVHPGHSLGEVLSSPSTWEVATSLPSPYPTNGFLIHSEGFYWFADRSLYPGVSNDDIARRILGVDLPVSRLHIANSLRHHDLHGHECRGLMFVSEENDADVEGDAEPDVLVRNVFFDLRPLGFGLQIVRTYREVWTRAQIFGLLQLQEPAGWDIHIDGGGADSLHVQVMRNSVIMLYGTPISSSQAESVESESDHDEDVDLDSADERRSAASESEVHPPEVPERGRSRSPPPSSSRTLHREALACEDQLDALLLLHFSAIGVVIWYRVFARNIVYFLLLVCLCQPCRKNAPGRTPRDGLTGESCSAHADLAEVILAPVRGIVSPTALGTDDIPESPGVVLQGTAEAAATQGVLQSAPALEANFLVLRLGCRHTHIVLREPFFACNESIFCRLRLALAGAGEPTPLSGIPTTPQLGRRFASVVMVPTWVLSSLRRVIVFDFSQIGGPVYASLIWDPVTFSDLTVAASAQGLDNWAVFLDDTPHALDATFSRKVLNGTVFCFVRRGHSPDWGPVFDAELSNSQSWDCRPPESLLQPCRPSWLLLYEGVTRRLGHFGKPVVRLLDLAREHTYRRAVHLSFGCPLSADLADSFVHQGRGVCGLLAAVPRSEAIDPGARLGAFVFLDARLIDGDVAFRFVAPGWHSVEELAGPLNIRMPAGCCVAILDQGAARTSVFVRHGDSLQLGFMPLPHARLPSGVPGLPRFRYCRGADPPDLTVHRDGQIDLTHQQHLQLLFQPFGEGQVPDGAPPELDRQDPDEAADLEMAPPFIHAMFLVLTPDYAPDVVVVYLRAPCTVEDAFDEIEDVRDADRKSHLDRFKSFEKLPPKQAVLALCADMGAEDWNTQEVGKWTYGPSLYGIVRPYDDVKPVRDVPMNAKIKTKKGRENESA
ncbi:unnamed protein product [Symbiodinium microadriaticum]|nr:unnamed protein product [Symbiodinium microadriaticum]